MHYWLFKSEANCFSFEDLANNPQQTTSWDGVRNYQARNFMKSMNIGDKGFFYHSGKNPEIVGTVQIVKEAYPDHTAWDIGNNHFDTRSSVEKPLWYMVDVKLEQIFQKPLSRKFLSQDSSLFGMELFKKGNRLSVQPVSEPEFHHILVIASR